MSEKLYKYYSIFRPPSIGTYPKENVVEVIGYDKRKQVLLDGTMAFGEIIYNRKLTEKEIKDYELVEGITEEKKKEALKDLEQLNRIDKMLFSDNFIDKDLQILMKKMSNLINKEIIKKMNRNNITDKEFKEKKQENFWVELDKSEAIRYYADKIIYDCLTDCIDNNICFNVDQYKNNIFLAENFDKIVEIITKDERVCDLAVDNKKKELNLIFYLEYCPHCYQEDLNISNRQAYEYIRDFESYVFDWSISMPKDKFRTNTREMIRGFTENRLIEPEEGIEDLLKKVLNESGFIDKYIDGYTVYINPDNINEMRECLFSSMEKIRLSMENEEIENG